MPMRESPARADLRRVCRGVLVFWALWFSVVLASNLTDGLRHAGVLGPGWRFASGNLQLIAKAIAIYALPEAVAALLFIGVLVAQLATALSFWRAAVAAGSLTGGAAPKAIQAFALGIGVFAAFLVADELLIVYERFPGLETGHFLVLCGLILSALLIYALGRGEATSD